MNRFLFMLMTISSPRYMTTTSTHVHQHTCKPPIPKTQKNLKYLYLRFLLIQTWRCPTLTWGSPTLPSALQRFTSKFGMELGGSTALSPPRYSVDVFSCLLYSSVLLFFVLCFLHSRTLIKNKLSKGIL